jgi:hypothetical protein
MLVSSEREMEMTNTYQINAFYAVSKAKEAVQSWEAGVAKAKEVGASMQDVRFCEESLRKCQENLAKVRRDVKENWTAYL